MIGLAACLSGHLVLLPNGNGDQSKIVVTHTEIRVIYESIVLNP